MPTTTLLGRDGTGTNIQINVEQTGSSFTHHSAPEVGGAPVSVGNPLPMNDQALEAAVGAPTDGVFSGGATGTLVGLLKGLVSLVLPGSATTVQQKAATLLDISTVATVAATSTLLALANTARSFLVVQAPQTADVWLNLSGGTAGPNAVGSIRVAQGTRYELKKARCSNAISYYCATAGIVLTALSDTPSGVAPAPPLLDFSQSRDSSYVSVVY